LRNEARRSGLQLNFGLGDDGYGLSVITTINVVKPL
jgi:hypothetical protein